MKTKVLIGLSLLLTANSSFCSNFETCKTIFNDHKFDSASNCFEELINKDSNDSQARFWYAASLYYDKRYEKSYQQYNFIAKKYPNSQIGQYAQKEAEKVKNKINYINTSKANDRGNYINQLDYATKWTQMPIRVWIEPSQYTNSVKQAFQQWQTKTDNAVKFLFIQNKNTANIRVYFVNKLTDAITKDQLGSTSLKFTGKKNYSADVQLLQRTPSNQFCSNKQMYYTALHEIGHALGISGHSSGNNDIMYYNTSTNSTELSQRDINTIKTIYAK